MVTLPRVDVHASDALLAEQPTLVELEDVGRRYRVGTGEVIALDGVSLSSAA